MGRLEGKVAFITGAARGQGRSHAIRLAQEGADIIAVDLCGQVDTVPYEMSTPEDLEQTVKEVESLDRRIFASQADVRDVVALKAAVDAGVAELGRLDIVSANAGIAGGTTPTWETPEDQWQNTVDTNLTGVWHTAKVAIPHMLAAGNGGSIILTSSSAGLKAVGNIVDYVSAKHGVVGLMRTLAIELAPYSIRVNTVNPTTVNTPMIQNDWMFKLFRPDLENPTVEDAKGAYLGMNALPIPWVEPVDISNAVLWLASDESRYVTGVTLPIDAGFLVK